MARIAGVNIPTNKRVVIALQYIHGIGPRIAGEIIEKVNIAPERRVNELSDAEVIQVREVTPGESVGYGNSWVARVPSRIATISAGYADGIIRAMGPKAHVWAGENRCKIIGRISMDLIAVDVGGVAEIPDYVELLGPHQSVDTLAEAAGTIGYEILTSLGNRYMRHYIGE